MPEYQYKKLGSLAEGDVKVNVFGVISSIIKVSIMVLCVKWVYENIYVHVVAG